MRTQYKSDVSDPSDKSDLSDVRNPYGFRTADAETFANTLICLIHQASYLIGRPIRRLERMAGMDDMGRPAEIDAGERHVRARTIGHTGRMGLMGRA